MALPLALAMSPCVSMYVCLAPLVQVARIVRIIFSHDSETRIETADGWFGFLELDLEFGHFGSYSLCFVVFVSIYSSIPQRATGTKSYIPLVLPSSYSLP